MGASRITESYPARLASAIDAQLDREVLLLNLSLSGATIESVELTQIPQMRGLGLMPQESRAQDMSDRIAAAVADSDAHVVDLRSLTQEYSLPTYTFAYHAADFFHPNSAAYAKWAQLFADAWATSRREAAPVVEDAPQWDILSARVAQSEYDD